MLAVQKSTRSGAERAILQPICPSCGALLRLARYTPGSGGLVALMTYACRDCGVWLTEAADNAHG